MIKSRSASIHRGSVRKWCAKRRRGGGYGRIIARLRAWEQYAALRRAGRRVVSLRPRSKCLGHPWTTRQMLPVMFIGSEDLQRSMFKPEAVTEATQ